MEQDTVLLIPDSATVMRRINAEPRHKLVLYRLVDWCRVPRFIEEIDERAAAYAEMRTSPFSVRTIFSWLVDCGAVRELTQAEVALLAGEAIEVAEATTAAEPEAAKAVDESLMGYTNL